MIYAKPPLTFIQQADLLISRGLLANRDQLAARLSQVNYYRLSAYLYPYRLSPSEDNFKPGTKLEAVWSRYTFDRQLRLIVMDAIERVEISVKTKTTETLTTHFNDPFAHLKRECLIKHCHDAAHTKFIGVLRDNMERSHEEFVRHYKAKYTENPDLPLWMAAEIMSFGNFLTLYNFLEKHLQAKISANYGIPPLVLGSWLTTLNYIRNICAHHGRLWNRELAIKPFIPRNPMWQSPVPVLESQRKMFAVLTILKYWLDIIANSSRWSERFTSLISKYDEIPLVSMGFPENWKECTIWTAATTSAEQLPAVTESGQEEAHS